MSISRESVEKIVKKYTSKFEKMQEQYPGIDSDDVKNHFIYSICSTANSSMGMAIETNDPSIFINYVEGYTPASMYVSQSDTQNNSKPQQLHKMLFSNIVKDILAETENSPIKSAIEKGISGKIR